MATHEEIFSRMGEKLGRTNLFLALGKDASCKQNDFIPKYMSLKSEFNFPPAKKRCKLTSFILSHNIESSVIAEETPAKTRKISGTRNVFNTPQPMEICTPLATKPNGMTAHNTYLYPLNGPELEMEVTPCVRTYAKSKYRQNNKPLTYSASQNNQVLIRKNGNEEATLELDYSVSEAEEMFRNASLRTDPHKTWLFWEAEYVNGLLFCLYFDLAYVLTHGVTSISSSGPFSGYKYVL
jgi:hypothetical protein